MIFDFSIDLLEKQILDWSKNCYSHPTFCNSIPFVNTSKPHDANHDRINFSL